MGSRAHRVGDTPVWSRDRLRTERPQLGPDPLPELTLHPRPPAAVWYHPTEPAMTMTPCREPSAVVQPHLEQHGLIVTPQGGSGRPGC